ncbi:MAG: Fic family protein [Candidatus Dependentiae bacterium]
MFEPVYSITPLIAKLLMRISGLKQDIDLAPITPTMLAHLRATARMSTIHYSTKIEGNRLTLDQVKELIKKGGSVGRKRDENEVLGYYAALDQVDTLAKKKKITQKDIQHIHAIVMNGGKKRIKQTPYRDGQNVIKDGATGDIVYLPPEAHDVVQLMQEMVDWINDAPNHDIPVPLIAGIVHYQFVTIHPYYDGNGRTARLLATLILHQGGYDLKGIYCLEEYYAKDLVSYYRSLTVGPSHNYYMGRAESDITSWVEYFCRSMLKSFETVKRRALGNLNRNKDIAKEIRHLDARKRALLTLFVHESEITAKDVQDFFNIKSRTARHLCKQWVLDEFLVIVNPSKKLRTYALADEYKKLI